MENEKNRRTRSQHCRARASPRAEAHSAVQHRRSAARVSAVSATPRWGHPRGPAHGSLGPAGSPLAADQHLNAGLWPAGKAELLYYSRCKGTPRPLPCFWAPRCFSSRQQDSRHLRVPSEKRSKPHGHCCLTPSVIVLTGVLSTAFFPAPAERGLVMRKEREGEVGPGKG